MADQQTPPPQTGNGARGATDTAPDDLVVPFQTDRAGALGRVVKLGASVDEILKRHAYPEPVAQTLGEALALTAMLGTTLKSNGRLILQTSSNGPLRMLIANFDKPGRIRGYASFDESLHDLDAAQFDMASLFGTGHMALTIDPGDNRERYQGIVALDGSTLTDAALNYFRQSEQLPTFLKLTVARIYIAPNTPPASASAPSGGDADKGWHWRAGGLLVQHVAREGGLNKPHDHETDNEAATSDDNDTKDDNEDWQRTRLLAETVEDHELLDPGLTPETILYRLFHEEGARVTQPFAIEAACRCSRERVETFVKNFSPDELSSLREPDGGVTVTCEFCNSAYRFAPGEL